MNLRMTGENILLSIPEAAPEVRVSGLIVPDSAASPFVEALVVAVGPGRTLDSGAKVEPEVVVGDWVLVNKHGGLEIERAGQKYRQIQPHGIVAVVDSPYATAD